MMHDAPERASFPVSPENTPTKRRAVFSASFAGLTSHHVQPDICLLYTSDAADE